MKTISRYLMTLVALFAMTTGAWANIATIEFTKETMPGSWRNNFTLISPDYLPDFKPATDAEAIAWCASKTNRTILIYGFDGEKVKYVQFKPASGYETRNEISTLYDFYEQVMENNYIVCYTTFGVVLNDTKTEASFDMPTYDLTVDYELVRDMSIGLIAQVGDDPQVQPRYRVKKEDNVFKPADLSPAQVMALFSVSDQIEQKVLTPTTDYIVNIYAIDEEGQPTGDPMTFQNFSFEPGIYAVKAVAAEGSPYDGESALSNKFVLFQGYEVYVPAGEYVTYYRNEALRVDEADKENFKLYTVSSVSGDKATLSNAFDAAPSNTPFLVYNNTNESKTVLLIPCNEPDLALTVADQFQGTMEEKTFTDADMAAADYYVCNGKQFVKVRGAGTLGANKAYLKFVTDQQLSAPQYINIVMGGDLGEGTTGINNVNDNLNDNEATWYDLNGRKLNGKPAQKGIYIKNGKKVVVH